jgi:hypothetical protein
MAKNIISKQHRDARQIHDKLCEGTVGHTYKKSFHAIDEFISP